MGLVAKGLDVSFSKVAYRDIAPRVGLDPLLKGNDMQAFDIHRARIPTSLFKAMVEDLDVVMNQYGEPRDHKNEEARSRFLAPVSTQSASFVKNFTHTSPAFQSYRRSFQINYCEYPRVYDIWSHNDERMDRILLPSIWWVFSSHR